MAAAPSDDELLAFADLMLRKLPELPGELTEPQALAQAISEQRELWVTLYRTSLEFDEGESST